MHLGRQILHPPANISRNSRSRHIHATQCIYRAAQTHTRTPATPFSNHILLPCNEQQNHIALHSLKFYLSPIDQPDNRLQPSTPHFPWSVDITFALNEKENAALTASISYVECPAIAQAAGGGPANAGTAHKAVNAIDSGFLSRPAVGLTIVEAFTSGDSLNESTP